MNKSTTKKIRPVFGMRQLVFIGFFCGPLGLGIALRQSLRRVGEGSLGKTALLAGLMITVVEGILFAGAPINVIYFHVASGVMGKLAYDRWLMRPALQYEASGGYFSGTPELLVFVVGYSIAVLAFVWGLVELLTYLLGA